MTADHALESLEGTEIDRCLNVPSLDKIQAFEAKLRLLPQIDIETKHHFAQGLYAREIFIPAGTCLTGKIHKTEHFNVLALGEITVWTEQGMRRLKAPFTMVSLPGTKRVGYAHSDCVWITVHGTSERDLERLEQELIEPETFNLVDGGEITCLGSQQQPLVGPSLEG